MIKSLRMVNVKGQNAMQEFDKKTLIVGPNGSGKSTRIQSLGIAILGYAPGNGKTSAETFKLATGDTMTIGLGTEHFSFSRTFTRNEILDTKTGKTKVEINQSLSVSPGKGEKKDADKKARIAEEIGTFPVMMDFSEFLSLSDAKRRDFIYSLSPISTESWSRERIVAHLVERLLTAELSENNPDQFQTMEDMINEAVQQFPAGLAVSDGLQSMIDWTENELKLWNSKKKDAQGAVRQIAEKKNELEETDRNIADAKRELEELHAELIKVEKQISQDTEKRKALAKRSARLEELRGEIAKVKAEPVQADCSDIDVQIAALESETVEALDIEALTAPLKVKAVEAKAKYDEHNTRLQGLLEKKRTVASTIKSLEDALQKVGELGGACIISSVIACPKDFTGFDAFIDKKKAAAATEIAELDKQMSFHKVQMDVFASEELQVQNERETILKKAQEVNKKNAGIQKQIAQLQLERNNRQTAGQHRDNKLKLLENELNRLNAEPVDAIGEISIMEMQASGLRNQIGILKQTIQEKEKAKQTILLLQQSMLDNRKAEYKAICLKQLQEALGPKGVQGEIVKEIIGPIKNDIWHNLKCMGFHFEPFFQTESATGQQIFQFGWINEKGHFVNFDALSTGQQVIYLAAMMMTIIDRAQPKLKLLVMDNLNHLDSRNFQLLLDGIGKLEDRVDNIILAGAVEYSFNANGWLVSNLGSKVEGDLIQGEAVIDATP